VEGTHNLTYLHPQFRSRFEQREIRPEGHKAFELERTGILPKREVTGTENAWKLSVPATWRGFAKPFEQTRALGR
jgi:hypothetical protein